MAASSLSTTQVRSLTPTRSSRKSIYLVIPLAVSWSTTVTPSVARSHGTTSLRSKKISSLMSNPLWQVRKSTSPTTLITNSMQTGRLNNPGTVRNKNGRWFSTKSKDSIAASNKLGSLPAESGANRLKKTVVCFGRTLSVPRAPNMT